MIKESDFDIKIRLDRTGMYFRKYLDDFIFIDFSENFLKKFDASELLKGVPMPLRNEDFSKFREEKGISLGDIAENMAYVTGCDPHFKYVNEYIAFLKKIAGSKLSDFLLKKAGAAASNEDFETAFIFFRACLCEDMKNAYAMYSYAWICTKLYEKSEDTEYVGRMKAEAIDFFELCTLADPKFSKAYYFLGFAYLNMGLYIKAKLAFEKFLKLEGEKEDKDKKKFEEVSIRLKQIKEPVLIEEGCNHVIAARFEEGINILEPFLETSYKDWWPLSYYLGISYEGLGDIERAEKLFKDVLKLNGSHIKTMESLCRIYDATGDKVNAEKYRNKIEIVNSLLKEEAAEMESD